MGDSGNVVCDEGFPVSFENITYEVPKDDQVASFFPLVGRASSDNPRIKVLNGVSGRVNAGESLAILGPSGSGKTSLLNLLAGRTHHRLISGAIRFRGQPRTARTKRDIGYVMQDDVFFSQLTVRETLEFTANIRIPSSVSLQSKKNKVEEVLNRLRLLHCQHTRIGDQQFDKGISGGERKRLSIANEILHGPKLILADECTSGLDSASAYDVTEMLSELCKEGKTVIITIHQPSSRVFRMFSKLLFLVSGQVAYLGPPSVVIKYFEAIDFPFPGIEFNPADFIIDLVSASSSMKRGVDRSTEPSVRVRVLDAWKSNGPDLVSKLTLTETGAFEEICRLNPRCEQEAANSIVIPMNTSETEGQESSPSSLTHVQRERTHRRRKQFRSRECGCTEIRTPTTSIGRLIRAFQKRSRDILGCRGKNGESDKYPTSWLLQVRALAQRSFRQKRGLLFQRGSIIQLVSLIWLAGFLWLRMDEKENTIEDRLGFFSFSCVFWAFQTTAAAIFAFPSEKAVLHKDRASGSYRLSAYYFAKTMVETPADVLYPAIYSSVVYYMVGLNPAFVSYLLFAVILILSCLTAQSVGIFVSACMMDVKQAQAIGTVWILGSMLTSGYHIDPDNMPKFVRPLCYLSFPKVRPSPCSECAQCKELQTLTFPREAQYAYEAMVRVEMRGGRTFACVPGTSTVYSHGGATCPIDKDALLAGAQLDDSLPIAANIGILIGWIVVLRLAGYFALKLLNTSHKGHPSTWTSSSETDCAGVDAVPHPPV